MEGWVKIKVLSKRGQEQGPWTTEPVWLVCQELESPVSLPEYGKRLVNQAVKWPQVWAGYQMYLRAQVLAPEGTGRTPFPTAFSWGSCQFMAGILFFLLLLCLSEVLCSFQCFLRGTISLADGFRCALLWVYSGAAWNCLQQGGSTWHSCGTEATLRCVGELVHTNAQESFVMSTNSHLMSKSH